MELGQVCHGFRLLASEPVLEANSTALRFVHERTGAELLYLSNEDDNKVFMVTFATPPGSDNGVPHILEHSVLNGSRNYPVREPFVELLKASMYTFLNAMTYTDKTVYPVASRNDQDFRNLMDVYLDAVFNPLLTRNTFMQEGWHYELDEETGELRYTGVVYNEMLGVYSDPQALLHGALEKSLTPDGTYGRDAGGDPAAIPQLSYEEFVAFHKRLYHPSNARIYLYGDGDITEKLAHLQQFLRGYERQVVSAPIITQPRFSAPRRHHASYPVAAGESLEKKAFILNARLIPPASDEVGVMGRAVLARILTGNSASPLRKALVDSHLGEDTINYGIQQDQLDPYFAVGLRGSDAQHADAVETLIEDTLRRLASDGLDARTVEAAMNTEEFHLREANFGGYPRGLVYAIESTRTWLYGGDPLAPLRYEAPLAELKAKVAAGGYFEQLIRDCLLDNPHRVTVLLTPDAQHEERRLAALREQLATLKAGMTPARLASIKADMARLKEVQETPDTPEALASIPLLPLSCVKRQAEELPFELRAASGPKLSFSRQPTNGIAYLRLGFDATGVPTALLPWLGLFGSLTLQTGTRQRDYVNLTQELGIHTGGLGSGFHSHARRLEPEAVVAELSYSGKALTGKVGKLVALVAEVISSTDFSRHERLGELITMAKSRVQASIVPSGHSFANTRLAARHSRVGRYQELTGGLSQYEFLKTLETRFKQDPGALQAELETLRTCLFRRGGLHVHLTGGDAELAALEAALPELHAVLGDGVSAPLNHELALPPANEGLLVPSKVQYVGLGANFYQLGMSYNGAFEVLRKWLSRDYLWNRVRVQGGAYGCFASFDLLSGVFTCTSYRDPRLSETLATYREFAEHLAKAEWSQDEFEKLVIGTMGGIDSPLTPEGKGSTALNRYLSGVTQVEVQRRREEVLGATPEQVRAFAEVFRRFTTEATICVVGAEDKLKAEKASFAVLRPVFTT